MQVRTKRPNDPNHARGVTRAREWLEDNGLHVAPLPQFGPDAYAKRNTALGVFETVAVVETTESVSTAAARERMRACSEWSGRSRWRRRILFVPRGAVWSAADRLPDYDGMVVYPLESEGG